MIIENQYTAMPRRYLRRHFQIALNEVGPARRNKPVLLSSSFELLKGLDDIKTSPTPLAARGNSNHRNPTFSSRNLFGPKSLGANPIKGVGRVSLQGILSTANPIGWGRAPWSSAFPRIIMIRADSLLTLSS